VAIPSSGQSLSLSALRTEFVGGSSAISLGDLYRGGTNIKKKAGDNQATNLAASVATSGAIALTLANGSTGQVKIITMITDGGDATLTPTTLNGYTTVTFNTDGDACILLYTDSTAGWSVIANQGCTLA